MLTLKEIFKKYGRHPDFMDEEIIDVNQIGFLGDAPLHKAAFLGELEEIEVLVAHEADVDLPGDIGNTPLHNAAQNGKTTVVKKLLELGANPLIQNEFKQSPARIAQLHEYHEIVEILNNWKA